MIVSLSLVRIRNRDILQTGGQDGRFSRCQVADIVAIGITTLVTKGHSAASTGQELKEHHRAHSVRCQPATQVQCCWEAPNYDAIARYIYVVIREEHVQCLFWQVFMWWLRRCLPWRALMKTVDEI